MGGERVDRRRNIAGNLGAQFAGSDPAGKIPIKLPRVPTAFGVLNATGDSCRQPQQR